MAVVIRWERYWWNIGPSQEKNQA